MNRILLFVFLQLPFLVYSQQITSITPSQGFQGQSVPLIISGNNMNFSGWSCWSNTGNLSDFRFSQWSGINMFYGIPNSSNNIQLIGSVNIDPTQALGVYDLEVYDCSGAGWVLFPNSFQVLGQSGPPSWNCVGGACVDPGNGSGAYGSLAVCQVMCGVNQSWNCINGVCVDPGDGSGTYLSQIACQVNCVQTQVTLEKIEGFSIYPNPSMDIFNIEFTSLVNQDLELRIMNSIGEIVYIDRINNYIGEYSKIINLDTYSKSIYFLELKTNDGILNKKLILQ